MIKKILIGAIVGILLLGIPLAVYFLKQQEAPPEEPVTPIPTVTPVRPTPTAASPTPTLATPTPQEQAATDIPVCTDLTLNRSATGSAPFTVRLTATGSDSDGIIEKVTFRLGDGQVIEITTGGGIGTGSVNAQATHTYTTAGTYTAEAILTDDQDSVSADGECTQAITVTAGAGSGVTTTPTPTLQSGTTASPTATLTKTPTPTQSGPTPTRTPTPTQGASGSAPTSTPQPSAIEEPGSEEALGIGSLAILLVFVGAFLTFSKRTLLK